MYVQRMIPLITILVQYRARLKNVVNVDPIYPNST